MQAARTAVERATAWHQARAVVIGVIGFFMRRYGYPIAPLVIGRTFDHPREIFRALHRIRRSARGRDLRHRRPGFVHMPLEDLIGIDMAKEMMSFTRSQILSQAGTAMLAQANQASQGVLSLLR